MQEPKATRPGPFSGPGSRWRSPPGSRWPPPPRPPPPRPRPPRPRGAGDRRGWTRAVTRTPPPTTRRPAGAEIRFVYRDVFPGYAAVLPPGGLRGVEGGRGSSPSTRTSPVRLPHRRPRRETAGRGPGAVGTRPHRPARAAAVGELHAADRRRAGQGVTAYVIDTGIAAHHRDFGGRVRVGLHRRSTTAAAPTTAPGTAPTWPARSAATPTGWRQAVSLVAVRTLDCEGSGDDLRGHRRHRLGGPRPRCGPPAVANLSLARIGERQRRRRDPRAGRRRRDRAPWRRATRTHDACGSSPAGSRRADRRRRPRATTGARRSPTTAGASTCSPRASTSSPTGTPAPTATEELSGTSMAPRTSRAPRRCCWARIPT